MGEELIQVTDSGPPGIVNDQMLLMPFGSVEVVMAATRCNDKG